MTPLTDPQTQATLARIESVARQIERSESKDYGSAFGKAMRLFYARDDRSEFERVEKQVQEQKS
jgi:hypothetical protein